MSQYQEITKELSQTNTTLVAVSKTKPIEVIQSIYNQGQRIFGENRAQELQKKESILPKDIEWHMIGHLQSNKVKYIAPFVHMIHSIDSEDLLKKVDLEAHKNNRRIHILLQVKIAEEDSKYGFSSEEAVAIAEKINHGNFSHTICRGLMGMATFTKDKDQIRREFKVLKKTFDHIKENFFSKEDGFDTISMGMSGDYQIAIEEGSTMVRIGSLIFGTRR